LRPVAGSEGVAGASRTNHHATARQAPAGPIPRHLSPNPGRILFKRRDSRRHARASREDSIPNLRASKTICINCRHTPSANSVSGRRNCAAT
ncbi:MAG TPA: hypothetical protein VGB42_05040, partial [Candidatus Thermoplasmatota archaeon]